MGIVVDEMREPTAASVLDRLKSLESLAPCGERPFKSLLAKKLRLVLTAVSVVLGIGFVSGTYVLTDTMNAAFEELFAQTSGASDVVVRSALGLRLHGRRPRRR